MEKGIGHNTFLPFLNYYTLTLINKEWLYIKLLLSEANSIITVIRSKQ